MIDFHSHIVHQVDDGAETIEETMQMLKEAKNAGFDKILLTPHYMPNYYEVPRNQIQEKIEQIKEKCKEEKLDIKLYQANEIYITTQMVYLLQEKLASTINNSRYVLFELPMNTEPPNLLEVIYQLLENGKKPIIAHPERYLYIQKEPNKLLEFVEHGVLFQANYGSIIGKYGKECQKTVKQLIKHNFIHFLGTDIHKTSNIYTQIEKIKKDLKSIISEEKIEELSTKNAEKVIKDEKFEVEDPLKIEEVFWKRFFIQ